MSAFIINLYSISAFCATAHIHYYQRALALCRHSYYLFIANQILFIGTAYCKSISVSEFIIMFELRYSVKSALIAFVTQRFLDSEHELKITMSNIHIWSAVFGSFTGMFSSILILTRGARNETVVFSFRNGDEWRQGDDLCSLRHKYTPFPFFSTNIVFQFQTGAFLFFGRFGA